MRFPNSTNAWKSCSGRYVSPQRGQFSHPSPDAVRRTVAPLATMKKSAATARYESRWNVAGRTVGMLPGVEDVAGRATYD
jgi:hypothetical protein